MARDDEAYDEISFRDIVNHTLLDMFEFGVHSFKGVSGPYFWNSIGIDFESPMPKEEILAHAKNDNASKIYVAHTHPLANDSSLTFINANTDPREKIAYSEIPLPLGNMPSTSDVTFLGELKSSDLFVETKLVGAVFSASGLWEFDIPNLAIFDGEQFAKDYDSTYPTDATRDYLKEWSARGEFPSYFMELQKPKLHQDGYKPTITRSKTPTYVAPNYDEQILKATKFFKDNGVMLVFHPYTEFGIKPLEIMRSTFSRWTDVFVEK